VTRHADARPLLVRGRLVTVDGHPICAVCGVAVLPLAGTAWGHLPAGRPYPRGSRWFAPVTWHELRDLRTYQEFTERFPWTVRPELCGGVITSETDWREGNRRLREYHDRLTVLRRRRTVRREANPYLSLVEVLAGVFTDVPGDGTVTWSVPGGLGHVLGLPARRRELAGLFCPAIPGTDALAVLAGNAPLLQCGAGTGYWAALLTAGGADILACDAAPPEGPGSGAARRDDRHRPWTEVRAADAVTAVRAHQDRTLFLCSPSADDDSASYAALRAYRGDTVVYVGGAPGGPAGTVRFHRELELNWHPAEELALPNWPGVHDRMVVYRRNPVRRPLTTRDRCPSCRRFLPTGAAGRCDACFAKTPPALALRVNGHRVEYPEDVLAAMPAGLRLAFSRSRALIRPETGALLASGRQDTGMLLYDILRLRNALLLYKSGRLHSVI
jgi:hypothetical protein